MASKGVNQIGIEYVGKNTSYKAAAEDAARATAELRRKANAEAKEIEQKFKMVTIAIAKIGAAVLVVKKGFDLYAKAMNSTEGSADKFEEQMAYLHGTLQGVMTTLFSGNWLALGANIKATAEATRDLAKAEDELAHAKARNAISKGDLEILLSEAKIAAAEETDKSKKAELLRDAIAYQRQITSIIVKELKDASAAQEAYYKKVFTQGRTDMDEYWKYVSENIVTVAKNYDVLFGQLETYKLILGQLEEKKRLTTGLSKADEIERRRLFLAISLMEDYIKLQDDLSKKGKFEEFLTGLGAIRTAAAEGENSLLRLTKQLTSLGVALDKADIRDKTEKIPDKIYNLFPSRVPTDKLIPITPQIPNLNTELLRTQVIANDLTGVFENMFSSVDKGIKGMTDSLIESLRRIATELAAKAVVFTILKLLFPEMMATTTIGSFMGLTKPGSGSAGVIKSGSTLATGGKIEIFGRLSGDTILLSSMAASNKRMNNT